MADSDPRVEFQADGLCLRGALFLPAGQGPHPGLILCHGLPRGLPPTPGEPGYPELAQRFCAGGFAVLFFNFRGTGESQGNFDILGWGRDLEAAVDYLWGRADVDRARLYVLGSSAGGAVAIYGAARDLRLAGVVAWAAPAHRRPIKDARGFLEHARSIGIIRDPSYPPSVEEWAQGFEEVSPQRWVGLISPRPLLIVHGEADDIIAPEQAWQLYRAARQPKELALLPGAGHRLRLDEQALATSLAWLRGRAGLEA